MRRTFLIVLLVAIAAGCSKEERQGSEGSVLAGGDPRAGKEAFVALGCSSCHEVYGGDLPKPTAKPEVPVFLGGNEATAPSREQLAREIIDPSHRIAPGWAEELVKEGNASRMPSSYAEGITVKQLVDVVAFLESRYGAAAEENVKKQQ